MSKLPREGRSKCQKAVRIGRGIFKFMWKIGVVTAGITAFTNPVSAAIAGTSAISSAISSVVKDRNLQPAMKIVNVLACNMDASENDPVTNS